jgi:hypothetical protein
LRPRFSSLKRQRHELAAFSNPAAAATGKERERGAMDLSVWIPALVLLGLGTMGLMFAFVVACQKI